MLNFDIVLKEVRQEIKRSHYYAKASAGQAFSDCDVAGYICDQCTEYDGKFISDCIQTEINQNLKKRTDEVLEKLENSTFYTTYGGEFLSFAKQLFQSMLWEKSELLLDIFFPKFTTNLQTWECVAAGFALGKFLNNKQP